MIQTVRKAWGVPELRKKLIFTAMILLIFRIGNAIPVPYVNTELLKAYLDGMGTTVLGLYNVMSGGAFAEATVFALGVQPYINSSIIIQLLTIAIPALERLARDGGEAGKKKIASITRYATVAIALLQGFGYYMIMKNYGILEESGIWQALVIIISTVFLVRLHPVLLVMPVLFIPFFYVTLTRYTDSLRDFNRQRRDDFSNLCLTVNENLRAVRIVRSFTGEAQEKMIDTAVSFIKDSLD